MPAIPSPTELLGNILVHRSTNSTPINATAQVLEVVCAWPVSGQYGPGTRVLYYVLMAACVFARKAEWIRNAGLAAVLLFPAVAALHGIVLAALHRKGAVDMDVYGAFQLCAIGILTAPATVRLSNTYFNNPGREIIFLWTGLLLAGLLSLTVEFIRLEATPCPADDPASLEWAATGKFSYGSNCSMVCGPDGPYSPLRQGAANNIYVIPVPYELTFNTATLLAAACCIPAILSLVSTWIKILDKNWEKLSLRDRDSPNERPDEQPIDGTNGATPRQMTWISNRVRGWLTLIEIPVFFAAVLAILVKGEMNFFSHPVWYQTEPITSIGQWAPIVGTGLAVVGSLYLLFAADMEADEKEVEAEQREEMPPTGRPDSTTTERCTECHHCTGPDDSGASTNSERSSETDAPGPDMTTSATQPSIPTTIPRAVTNQSEKMPDPGGRRRVARFFNMMSKQIAKKAHSQFEDTGFSDRTFPTVPAEDLRNKALSDIQKAYNTSPAPRSIAASFVGSDLSNGEGSSRMSQSPSRQLSLIDRRPARSATRQHAYTLPSQSRPPTVTILQDTGPMPSARHLQTAEVAPDQPQAGGESSMSEIGPTTASSSSPDAVPTIVVSSDFSAGSQLR
ncbi:uncharacterized protein N7459_004695 [Penicillium hispanicum]|uniref:uncharacterized protein n=1 Tax=Penicillium hispanicum TaxID=1080232 RepID=UPI0025401BC6|nr:uncharacterized protein N7459_004695 [Penicillium hispanicum]KAJ5584895.1 hypothetical protein N7459_004695 [Penicillium hispanicum]